jgi:hypothetical protein
VDGLEFERLAELGKAGGTGLLGYDLAELGRAYGS